MRMIDELRVDNDKIIRLVKGDITERNGDVIVNAANWATGQSPIYHKSCYRLIRPVRFLRAVHRVLCTEFEQSQNELVLFDQP